MEISQVEEIVRAVVPDARVEVEGEGCSFVIKVVSDRFESQGLLARQRLIMSAFADQIASGELHALTVKALTPEEAEQRS